MWILSSEPSFRMQMQSHLDVTISDAAFLPVPPIGGRVAMWKCDQDNDKTNHYELPCSSMQPFTVLSKTIGNTRHDEHGNDWGVIDFDRLTVTTECQYDATRGSWVTRAGLGSKQYSNTSTEKRITRLESSEVDGVMPLTVRQQTT